MLNRFDMALIKMVKKIVNKQNLEWHACEEEWIHD